MDPELEPDLYAISAEFPVPEKPPTREIRIVQKTIEEGPRARMPVHWSTSDSPPPPSVTNLLATSNVMVNNFANETSLPSLPQSTGYKDLSQAVLPSPLVTNSSYAVAHKLSNEENHEKIVQPHSSNLVSHFDRNAFSDTNTLTSNNAAPALASAYSHYAENNDIVFSPSILSPDSQFAAGFMAATAYHSNHIRNMLRNAFMNGTPITDYVCDLAVNPTYASADSTFTNIFERAVMEIEPNFYHRSFESGSS